MANAKMISFCIKVNITAKPYGAVPEVACEGATAIGPCSRDRGTDKNGQTGARWGSMKHSSRAAAADRRQPVVAAEGRF